ncbi:hypothetical protein Nepgr_024074 [Nepenthes gracilis]|uniref:Uncharacterized protein n=1 Tax=Nepenthes gracilis TaxID=150966 RepID=A0AAD3Y044_NEPGR|nr:hypothetical protein Nepgr_024074 [Nepenthes gracilis]
MASKATRGTNGTGCPPFTASQNINSPTNIKNEEGCSSQRNIGTVGTWPNHADHRHKQDSSERLCSKLDLSMARPKNRTLLDRQLRDGANQ